MYEAGASLSQNWEEEGFLKGRTYPVDKRALITLIPLEEKGHTGAEVNKQPAAGQQ